MQNVTIAQNSTELTGEMIDTLIQAGVIPQNTPIPQIKVFAQFCSDKGLSPFAKEVYLLAYGNVYSRIVGIDGFRKIAARTGQLAGCDDVKFDIKADGTWLTATDLIEKGLFAPKTATVTVWRIVSGMRVGFTHTAVFSEFNGGKQKWLTMPFQMIAKVAEAFAIRKGFSDEVSGLSIDEEVVAIQDLQILPTKAEPKPKPEMCPTYKGWEGCCKAVSEGITTLEKLETLYVISDENKAKLLALVPLNPSNLPEMTPEHKGWNAAKQAVQSGQVKLEKVQKKYYITPENIEKLTTDAI